MGLVDLDSHGRSMGRALASSATGSRKPKSWSTLGPADLAKVFEFVTRGGDDVTRFTPEGKLELRELEIKSVLDRDAGKAIGQNSDPKTLQCDDPEARSAASEPDAVLLEVLCRAEEEAVLAAVSDLAAQGGASRSWVAVLENFQDLIDGELSLRAVAKRSGLDEAPVRRALEQVAVAVHRRVFPAE